MSTVSNVIANVNVKNLVLSVNSLGFVLLLIEKKPCEAINLSYI